MAKRKQSTFERWNSGKLNRKQRKELIRKIEVEDPGLEIIHRNVAGIDVGKESHMVAVAADRDPHPVRELGSWTKGLQELADWLRACGTESVVMQSTGVYWVALYDVLEERGFQVCLANARDTKNLPGREERCAGSAVAEKAVQLRAVVELLPAAGANPGGAEPGACGIGM